VSAPPDAAPPPGPGFTITLYRDPAALAAGVTLAEASGVERRDAALLLAARALAGVDALLPPAGVARVSGPRLALELRRG
jgi:hypothetical protein